MLHQTNESGHVVGPKAVLPTGSIKPAYGHLTRDMKLWGTASFRWLKHTWEEKRTTKNKTSWWFQPVSKILVPNRGENKTFLKPPPRKSYFRCSQHGNSWSWGFFQVRNLLANLPFSGLQSLVFTVSPYARAKPAWNFPTSPTEKAMSRGPFFPNTPSFPFSSTKCLYLDKVSCRKIPCQFRMRLRGRKKT